MKREILSEIKNRKSITLFSERDIEKDKLNALIEAAKLAPSSYNNQPWNYVFVGKKDSRRKDVENSLMIGNGWAKQASHLIVVGGDPDRDTTHNGVYYYLYDIGLSVMSLILEAEHQGLKTHQMGGWEKDKLKVAINFPESMNPIVVIAIGYSEDTVKKGILHELNEKVKSIIIRPRKRKDIHENFFFNYWKGKTKKMDTIKHNSK